MLVSSPYLCLLNAHCRCSKTTQIKMAKNIKSLNFMTTYPHLWVKYVCGYNFTSARIFSPNLLQLSVQCLATFPLCQSAVWPVRLNNWEYRGITPRRTG